MEADGMAEVLSKYPVNVTADRFEELLRTKGIKRFARIDQAAEAAAVGLTLRPTVLIIFGDPKAGTPLMNRYPSLAIDLPLKALIWEGADGSVRIGYNLPEYLQQRHQMESPPFAGLKQLVAAAAE